MTPTRFANMVEGIFRSLCVFMYFVSITDINCRNTILALGSFLDTFQKIADAATNTKGEWPPGYCWGRKQQTLLLSFSQMWALGSGLSIVTIFSLRRPAEAAQVWIGLIFHISGATREIGACLTRIVIRHKAMEARMKTLSRWASYPYLAPPLFPSQSDDWPRWQTIGNLPFLLIIRWRSVPAADLTNNWWK